MSRYDWPARVDTGDDPGARALYNARHLPAPDVRQEDGSLAAPPPMPKKVPRRRGPKAPPGGGTQLWLPLGPSTVRGGQASGKPNVSGRIRDIAVHPDNGERVYLATASGGVWFSGDTGVSWRPLDEFVVSPGRSTLFPVGNALACGAIQVIWGAATNGSQDEVIVGTGEQGGSGGTPGGSMSGIGILSAVGPATSGGWIQHVGSNTLPSDTDDLRGEVVWRIAADPLQNGQLYAATSKGLYSRAPGGSWTREAAVTGAVIDVLVTRSSAPDRVRVWFAQRGGVKFAEGTTGTPANPDLSAAAIHTVPISGFRPSSRLVLGARNADTVWVLGTAPLDGDTAPSRLQRIDATGPPGSITAGSIDTIGGAPKSLFMSAGDQSEYDMALGVHPDEPNVVYLGGATTMISGDFNATMYRVEVSGTDGDAVEIGKGVHADVHVFRFGPQRQASTDRAVWVGCDGGVFLSTSDGRAETFVSRNNNLSTLQPGFVACHPTNEGILAAGMQDNGTCDRVGDTVWRESFEGDGGGVVYDPGNANRYFRQYTGASWDSSDHTGSGPVFRFLSAHAGTESDGSAFYSGAAALTHGGTTHLAVGTNRPWYSPDWGNSWVTLPTGTDPRSAVFPNLNQDLLVPVSAPSTACCTPTFDSSGKVLTCRSAPLPDKDGNHRVLLMVLWRSGLAFFVGSRATASTGAWSWTKAAAHQIRNPIGATEIGHVAAGDPTSFLPGPFLVNDVAIHDPKDGADATCYLATVGSTSSVDTLYWYDGQGHFIPCGTRRVLGTGTWGVGTTRITSPALSVIVDPATPPTRPIVYVGTSVGVIKGTQSFVGGNPHWDWENFENGLPEGAVHDLAVFDSGGVKLLRAALQARGVWETDLNTVVAQPRTILRVNATDSRRRRPTPLSGPAVAGEPNLRYDNSPDIVVDTTNVVWPAFGPDEAELMDARFAGTVGEHAAQAVPTTVFRVHVLVHRRWFAPAPPADVKVALLRHSFPADGSDVLLGGIWQDLVTIAGGGAAPGVLSGSWEKAANVLTKAIPAAVDVRLPRAVTFDVNLADLNAGDRVVLLAVVMSADDPIDLGELTKPDTTTITTLQDLVLHSRHGAARSLQMT